MPMHPSKPLLFAAAVVGLVAAAAPLRAETLADALIIAYQTSPQIESSRAALRALDENISQARAARRLQAGVGVNAGATKNTFIPDTDTVLGGEITTSLLLYDNGETNAAVESAIMTVAAGRADLQDVEQTVLLNAIAAYMDILRDQEVLQIAQNDVEVLDEVLRAAQDRFEVGEVTRTDVSLTEAQLAQSRAALALAQGNLQLAQAAWRRSSTCWACRARLEFSPPL